MRKLVFVGFIVLGVSVGLFSAANDDWSTRAVMMGVGALFGCAIGGSLARIGRRGPTLKWEQNPIPGMGVTSEDLAANYWRDKGHPPFMKPPEDDADPHDPGAGIS